MLWLVSWSPMYKGSVEEIPYHQYLHPAVPPDHEVTLWDYLDTSLCENTPEIPS